MAVDAMAIPAVSRALAIRVPAGPKRPSILVAHDQTDLPTETTRSSIQRVARVATRDTGGIVRIALMVVTGPRSCRRLAVARAAEPRAETEARAGAELYSAAFTRSFHVCAGAPAEISSIVMHPSTGQTSAQRLHPMHSASSTTGTRTPGFAPNASGGWRSGGDASSRAFCP